MKNKISQLRELMEKYELFQQDDEVGTALKELEDSIEEFEIYKEDFSDDSLEAEVLFLGGKIKKRTVYYESNT
jgi:hypothetical protein